MIYNYYLNFSLVLLFQPFRKNQENSDVVVCNALHLNSDPLQPHLQDDEFDKIVSQAKIFARAQPADKIGIVNSLKRQGHVVTMTGDGVNDVPALKAVDIGVAMGITGTDVAKDTAEILL